jgi:hypothetical protein
VDELEASVKALREKIAHAELEIEGACRDKEELTS